VKTETRLKFMGALAKMVQPDDPTEAAKALDALLPLLDKIPERAFASRTFLEDVATRKRRTIVPAFADVVFCYNQWVRDHPDHEAIEQEAPEHLADMDLAWWKYFRLRESESFGSVGGRPASSREHVLSLVKQQSLPAWQAITGGDGPREAWDVRQAMSQAAADAIAGLHAIQEPHGRPQDARTAPPLRRQDGRPLGPLSAEHLAEARRNAGMPGR
jgi:hypothetical protein